MKTLILFFLITTSSANKVYICDNGSTKVYHVNSGCNRLDRCKYEIKTMTKAAAEKAGLNPCKDKSDR